MLPKRLRPAQPGCYADREVLGSSLALVYSVPMVWWARQTVGGEAGGHIISLPCRLVLMEPALRKYPPFGNLYWEHFVLDMALHQQHLSAASRVGG